MSNQPVVPEYDNEEFVIITPAPRCTQESNEAFEQEIMDYIDGKNQMPVKKFLLDMTKVKSINSNFLGKILLLSRVIRPYGGRLSFFNPTKLVTEILDKTGYSTVFNVYSKDQRKECELYLHMPIDVLRDLSHQWDHQAIVEDETKLLEISRKVITWLANNDS